MKRVARRSVSKFDTISKKLTSVQFYLTDDAEMGALGVFYIVKANWRGVVRMSLSILCKMTDFNNIGI